MPWHSTPAVCAICRHTWTAVHEFDEGPMGEKTCPGEMSLGCPACGAMAGHCEDSVEDDELQGA